MMIPEQLVDCHVHITPPEISAHWQRYARKEPYFALLARSPHNRFATAEDALSALTQSGGSHAVVFGFAFRDMGLCRLVNDYVIEQTRMFPALLTGFMVVPPRGRGMEREIDRCHNAGLRGVGELFPAGQGFSLDDPGDTRALCGVCIERNIPLILHTTETVGHQYPGKNDIPLRAIERFVAHSQGLSLVLAHWGGGIFVYETMPELRAQFRTVYYDTAATPLLYDARIYQAALAIGLGEKILFGSDFPLLRTARYLPALEALPPDERRLIMGGNARRILCAS